MKIYIYTIMGAAVMLAGSCGRTVDPKKTPKTAVDSFSYTVGFNLGKGMKSQGLEKIDYSSLIRGIEEAMKKDSGYAINTTQMEKIQRGYIMHEQEKKIKGMQEENKKWMAENAKKGGVSELSSKGGQMKMIKAGTGAAPQAYDTIEYSVLVTNSKGKVVMDSRKKGAPRRHVLGQIGLAQLEEAFQKASQGSEFEVYLQNDMVPEIGQNAETFEDKYGITIFKVELMKVIPGKMPAPEKAPKMPTK